VKNRRRHQPTKPKVNQLLFEKLSPELKRALWKALGKKEEKTSLSDSPPGAPPPVVFFGYMDFLRRCSTSTLLELAGDRRRWYSMAKGGAKSEFHQVILERLGWGLEELHRWQNQEPPTGAEWNGTLGEWRLRYGERTDPPEPPEMPYPL
jgi:hypothetical protein